MNTWGKNFVLCNMYRVNGSWTSEFQMQYLLRWLSSCLEVSIGKLLISIFFLIAITDVYSLVQFPPQESRHTDWEHWRGLQKWPQTDAPLGSYLRLAKIKFSVYLQHMNWNTLNGTKIANDSKQWTQTISRLKNEKWNTL